MLCIRVQKVIMRRASSGRTFTCVVTGPTGSGKTCFLRRFLKYSHLMCNTEFIKSIIQEMRLTLTVEELKSKIKNIRTTYNREANKVAKLKKSGPGTHDVFKPQLILFSVADRFLKPVIEGRNSR